MEIHVFLLCHNEINLLPHAVHHYKKYLPSCKITICDNESTDGSIELAETLGCQLFTFYSNNCLDDFVNRDVKNNVWKSIEHGWIIVADLDEFLCVTEDELYHEMNKGTSILKVVGFNMIGESARADLSDIDLQQITKYVVHPMESKSLCFLRDKIQEMNYTCGAHRCQPKGRVVYSQRIYVNKHMSLLGLPYYIEKNRKRFERTHQMRKHKMAVHYLPSDLRAQVEYQKNLLRASQYSAPSNGIG